MTSRGRAWLRVLRSFDGSATKTTYRFSSLTTGTNAHPFNDVKKEETCPGLEREESCHEEHHLCDEKNKEEERCKIQLIRILQHHRVVLGGGLEDAESLLKELMQWKRTH